MEGARKRLEEYKSKKDEIREIQIKLHNIKTNEQLIGNDVIYDYSTGYPRAQQVIGYDYMEEQKLKNKWESRLEELSADCLEVELWIEEIPDSITRRIFRMCFIDRLSQQAVGRKVHLSQAAVSDRIANYIKSDNSDKEV